MESMSENQVAYRICWISAIHSLIHCDHQMCISNYYRYSGHFHPKKTPCRTSFQCDVKRWTWPQLHYTELFPLRCISLAGLVRAQIHKTKGDEHFQMIYIVPTMGMMSEWNGENETVVHCIFNRLTLCGWTRIDRVYLCTIISCVRACVCVWKFLNVEFYFSCNRMNTHVCAGATQ